MLTDSQIVQELELMPHVSTTYIQRRYKVDFQKAKQLQNEWVRNEPKEPTFEDRLKKFHENPPEKVAVIKKRVHPFFINGKFFYHWNDVLAELEKG